MSQCNAENRDSRFVPSERKLTSGAYLITKRDVESMNARSSMTHNARTMQTQRTKWKDINWTIAESYVNRLQVRIVKAVQKEKWRLVKRLQKLITNSFYAKAIAVKRVTTNKGKHTPGIDKVVWATDEDKSKAIEKLDTLKYHAQPLRRVYIEKYGKKEKRPLGIPTMQDRAMQGLMLLALEPVAETTADRVSFGFRKKRSAQDAMEYIFKLLARKTSPQWILEGDIKGCFDHISHEWMLENIPTDKRVMRQFLKCGYVDRRMLFPTEEGSPQGGLISPTYANLTLDGIEELLLKKYSTSGTGYIHPNYNKEKVHLCRYADDFIVTAKNKETLLEIQQMIEKFMEERGLKLSDEKTVITNIEDGFDFLGWNFRKFKGKLLIQPSKKSKQKVIKSLSRTIKCYHEANQELLIIKLNQITRGWAEYHHCVCAKKTYALIDHRLWEMLWKWAKRRHPRKGKKWIKNRYWHPKGNREWSFRTDKVILYQMMDMPIVRIRSLDLKKSPFLDSKYFEHRRKQHKKDKETAYLSSAAAFSGYYAL